MRTKFQAIESENEKLMAENKRLTLLKETKKLQSSKTSLADKKQFEKLEEELKARTEELESLKTKLTAVSGF